MNLPFLLYLSFLYFFAQGRLIIDNSFVKKNLLKNHSFLRICGKKGVIDKCFGWGRAGNEIILIIYSRE